MYDHLAHTSQCRTAKAAAYLEDLDLFNAHGAHVPASPS